MIRYILTWLVQNNPLTFSLFVSSCRPDMQETLLQSKVSLWFMTKPEGAMIN